VGSFAPPGGRITGVANMNTQETDKRLELLKGTIPKLSRAAILWNPDDPPEGLAFAEADARSKAIGVQLVSLMMRTPDDFTNAFDVAIGSRVERLVDANGPLLGNQRTRLIRFAVQTRLPGIRRDRQWTLEGGLMAYGANRATF
jgi:putative ABC transport system substrate-binding protein